MACVPLDRWDMTLLPGDVAGVKLQALNEGIMNYIMAVAAKRLKVPGQLAWAVAGNVMHALFAL